MAEVNNYDLRGFGGRHVNILRAGYNLALIKLSAMEKTAEINGMTEKRQQNIDEQKQYISDTEFAIEYAIEEYCKKYVNKVRGERIKIKPTAKEM